MQIKCILKQNLIYFFLGGGVVCFFVLFFFNLHSRKEHIFSSWHSATALSKILLLGVFQQYNGVPGQEQRCVPYQKKWPGSTERW